MAKSKKATGWQNRIVNYGEQPADQFLAHESNARRHPAKQRESLRGSLDELGWVAPVIVSSRSGKILDGHARVEEALSKDEATPVPFVEVDVSEAEERLVLATYDPITGLASYDREALDSLLREVQTGSEALQTMLSELAAGQDLISGDGFGTDFTLPDGDREPFQQMTFMVSDAQASTIKEALALAKRRGGFDDNENANSNGNAIAKIAEAYCG
jgi:hypothetical protein